MPEPETRTEPLYVRRQPGYFHCRKALKRTKRFQDLIRHKERWAGDIDLAQPIEELIPDWQGNGGVARIELEIEKLQQLVQWDMQYIGATNTGYLWDDPYHVGPDPGEPRRFDLVMDYFRLPRPAGLEQAPFNAVMRMCNNAVGVLEARKQQTFWHLFSPIHWIAWLIRLPITIMETAGFGVHTESQRMVLRVYKITVSVAMLALLIFGAIKTGIAVPWKELWTLVLRWLA
jgi:hypothetical protein